LKCKYIKYAITNKEKKCKMQKAPKPKHPGNPGHNEKFNLFGVL